MIWHIRIVHLWCAALFGILLVTCTKAAEVSEITLTPSTPIEVGQSATLSVTVIGPDPQFAWEAKKGSLGDPKNRNSVEYKAPDSPGQDAVTVKVTSGGVTTIKTKVMDVIPRAAAPTNVSSAPIVVSTATVAPTTAPTNPPAPTTAPTVPPPPTTAPTNPPAPTTAPTDTPTTTPTLAPIPATPLKPILCNTLAITKNVFAGLQKVPTQLAFYFPTEGSDFKCAGVYDRFKSPPLSVRIEFKSVAGNFGGWGIGTLNGYDASKFSEICFQVYVEQPDQAFLFKIKDTKGKEPVFKEFAEKPNQWNLICHALSEFTAQGLDLSSLDNVNLGFGTETGDAILWVDEFELK